MNIASFCFNLFAENTYVLWNSKNECIIVDPGCSSPDEEQELANFISEKQLTPVLLLNTHCHVDHILGNYFVVNTYRVPFWVHQDDLRLLQQGPVQAHYFGISLLPSPEPTAFIEINKPIQVGSLALSVFYSPGHSPGSVCFWNAPENYILSGDVLFAGSIGRTDLPGGSYPVLMQSLQKLIQQLPPETVVFPGHGQKTTIQHEIKHNPFLN